MSQELVLAEILSRTVVYYSTDKLSITLQISLHVYAFLYFAVLHGDVYRKQRDLESNMNYCNNFFLQSRC